jgi:hypothetical protein
MTTTFTTHFRFGLPDFLAGPWHADWYALVIKMDEILYELAITSNAALWENSHAYIIGNIVISPEDGFMWTCSVAHTSAVSPTTFSADRLAHPTFWTSIGIGDDLTAIEALTGTGFPARAGSGLWSLRTFTFSNGITITNPSGAAGSPNFAPANDLGAIEALSTVGALHRTASETWALRTLTGPAAGVTVSNGDGVAGNPTINLINDLGAIEALSTNGILSRTATDTWAIRTLQAPAAGIAITNPGGVAGDPTFALANDLGAIETLNTNAILVRTGTDTWAARTLTAPAAGLTITNPAGTAGNPTFAFANDLAAVEALAGTGVVQRTGTDTWSVGTTITVAQGGSGVGTLTDHGVLFGRGTGNFEASSAGTAGQVMKSSGSGANGAYADDLVGIEFIIDGGGVAITTGIKGDLEIPFNCTIVSATLLADQSGSIVVNVWKDSFANYPPVVGDKITASAPPTITATTKSQDTTLTGWTTSISAGDTLRYNVDSVSTIQRVTLSLKVRRT